MKEEFLHYVWRFQLFQKPLITTSGERIALIFPGEPNPHSGPDFFNARLKIGQTLWAGNVEIHLRSSDWYRHGHEKDEAYSNVILHIVETFDKKVFRASGEEVPTAEMRFHPLHLKNFELLSGSLVHLPCRDRLHEIGPIQRSFWINRLLVERFEDRSQQIRQLLASNQQHWEEAFFQRMARGFGSKVNADSFERLARSLPWTLVQKYRDHLFQLEALFFGQGGFLTGRQPDTYFSGLRREYLYLARKHSLRPLLSLNWKWMRMRPGNFPSLRIAQFAALIHQNKPLFSLLIGSSLPPVEEVFRAVEPSSYWFDHFRPGQKAEASKKTLSSEFIQRLIINAISPFRFAYGREKSDFGFTQSSMELLEQCGAEENSITRLWRNAGISMANAAESQALLQLFTKYCQSRRCLNCSWGDRLIRSEIKPKGNS